MPIEIFNRYESKYLTDRKTYEKLLGVMNAQHRITKPAPLHIWKRRRFLWHNRLYCYYTTKNRGCQRKFYPGQ